MTSDLRVGRQVRLHLMPSDYGRWVGKGSSDIRFVFRPLFGYSDDFCFWSFVGIEKEFYSSFISTFLIELFHRQLLIRKEKRYVMGHRLGQGVSYCCQSLTSDIRVGTLMSLLTVRYVQHFREIFFLNVLRNIKKFLQQYC